MAVEVCRRQGDRMSGEQRVMALTAVGMICEAGNRDPIDALAMRTDNMEFLVHSLACPNYIIRRSWIPLSCRPPHRSKTDLGSASQTQHITGQVIELLVGEGEFRHERSR